MKRIAFLTTTTHFTLEKNEQGKGSFDRISNRQEFCSIEMGHLTYNMGIGNSRFQEEESTFKHQIFDF